MALLDICQEAASQLGLRQPSIVVGSTDLTAQILFRFANQSGRELAKYHDWQALIIEALVTATASTVQTGALPAADFDRMIYNVEMWNRTTSQRYTGPTPQRYWARAQINGVNGLGGAWRLIGGQLNILPAPAANDIIAFEYISKRWARSSGGLAQSSYMADTDTTVLDENLLILEMVWRFRHSRGFAQYAEDMATSEREKEKAASSDRGTGRVRPENTRDSDWPPTPTWDGTIEQ